MKSKKELLKFFLERLELWNAFSAEVEKLHIYCDAPDWDCIDNNLDFLFNAVSLVEPNCKDIRVADRLKDKTYLDQLMNNEDLGSFTFAFAITDLCSYAGLQSEDSRVWDHLLNPVSIMDIIDKVYEVAKGQ